MDKRQSGFTLIELVVVIVILGILAATALPKFVDLSSDARLAAAKGVAGALTSATSMNYANALAKGAINGATIASATATNGTTDTSTCNDTTAAALVPTGVTFGASATNYTVSGTGPTTIGGVVTCSVKAVDDAAATASMTWIGAK